MTKRLWIYPALFCLLLSSVFSEGFVFLAATLCVIWFIRIISLKQPVILAITTIIGILFAANIFFHKESNQTLLKGTEERLLLYPDILSIKVDGDYVRFEGSVYSSVNQDFGETIVIQYKAKSEQEKNLWLNEPPDHLLVIEGELAVPNTASNFYQFDYQNYLQRRGIHWQYNAIAISAASSNIFSKSLKNDLNTVRFNLLNVVDRTFAPKVASYIKSLFLADRRGMSEDVLSDYRSIGVIHLFSISGFHISFLIKGLKYFFLRIGITHERTNGLLLLLIPVYGIIAGLRISVFRAVFQSLFGLISQFTHKGLDTIDAWSLTMLLALFINPFQIYDIAFQLSYALSGLLIVMNSQNWIRQLNAMGSTLLFSFLASLVSIPIVSYHFYEITWITLLSNMIFMPLFSYFLFPVLVALLILAPLLAGTTVFHFFNQIIAIGIQSLEQTLTVLNDTFDFSWVTGRLPLIALLLLVLSIFYIVKKIENKKWPSFISLSCLLLCLNYYQLSPIGYVMMLDVGQGDSILIKDPDTRKISLIDTGGQPKWQPEEDWQMRQNQFSIGEDVVAPALKAVGVSKLDYLYITHADVDHSGEIANIGKEIEIKEIITTQKTFESESIREQLKPLDPSRLTVTRPPEASRAPFKQSTVIHPEIEYSNSNNHSLVIYGKIGNDRWLFTGDIEEEVEEELIAAYPNLRTDYLKISHHGSNSSSTEAFIEHTQPHTALISAGKNNRFGHPHPEVLKRLEKKNTQTYQTNETGAVRIQYFKLPFADNWHKQLDTVHKN